MGTIKQDPGVQFASLQFYYVHLIVSINSIQVMGFQALPIISGQLGMKLLNTLSVLFYCKYAL